jgi:hypothetical protein
MIISTCRYEFHKIKINIKVPVISMVNNYCVAVERRSSPVRRNTLSSGDADLPRTSANS